MTDSIIRDKIILDTHDKILRKKLFDADNLDLSKLIAIYNDFNINTEKMEQVTKENKAQATSFTQKPQPASFTQKPQATSFMQDNNIKKGCWRCGVQHQQGKCPAWGSKCTKCGDINHFTQCCQSPKPKINKVMNCYFEIR